MTTTPELDRAIDAGHAAVNAKDGFPSDWREQGKDYDTDRTYARALVAELLRDMDEPSLDPPAILGWDLALKVIKRRAGIVEGEG